MSPFHFIGPNASAFFIGTTTIAIIIYSVIFWQTQFGLMFKSFFTTVTADNLLCLTSGLAISLNLAFLIFYLVLGRFDRAYFKVFGYCQAAGSGIAIFLSTILLSFRFAFSGGQPISTVMLNVFFYLVVLLSLGFVALVAWKISDMAMEEEMTRDVIKTDKDVNVELVESQPNRSSLKSKMEMDIEKENAK